MEPAVQIPSASPTETLDQAAWTRLAVPLKWLCGLDGPPSELSLPDAFGDSYLCANNRIYAAVRRAALQFGYRFSSADSTLFRDYQSFPLMTLPSILAGRTIPYSDTASTLRRLIETNPKAAVPASFLMNGVRRNHAFHESAHCVAHSVVGQTGSFVLEAIIAESFANACEWLAAECQSQRLADLLFYFLNSYRLATPELSESLADAAVAVGEEARFRILMLAFFESNLTPNPPDATILARISARARVAAAPGTAPGITPDYGASVTSITRQAFRLNTGFRDFTTPIWFELNGHKREFEQLTASERLGVPEVAAFVDKTIPRLWTLLK